MKKYEGITKYISQIEECTAGKWVIDKENDGTPEHPIHVPYVKYSKIIDAFIDDVYRFENENPESCPSGRLFRVESLISVTGVRGC